MAEQEEPQTQDIPGVTRPFTLSEAAHVVQRQFEEDGKLDPISADQENFLVVE